ncbi:UbiA family prenyltransferase, partial [Chitinophaga sp.]|uniref:UbiA family prenyltransferase n=1 Tax=Chitinophaga sp. TaxID=1869181 RepID=UPI0031D1BBC3
MEVLIGFFAFSLIASSIYIINDYNDVEADRRHPVKCKRPIASGAVSKPMALVFFVLCLAIGGLLAWYVKPKF